LSWSAALWLTACGPTPDHSDTDVHADTDDSDVVADTDTQVDTDGPHDTLGPVDTDLGTDTDVADTDASVDTDTAGPPDTDSGATDTDTDPSVDTDTDTDTDASVDTDTAGPPDTDSGATDTDTDTDASVDTDTAGSPDTDAPIDTDTQHDTDTTAGAAVWDTGLVPMSGRQDTSATVTEPVPCGEGLGADSTSADGTSCFLLFNTLTPQPDAEAHCVSLGGHLASPSDEAEDAAIVALGIAQSAFIGATDAASEGRWSYVDGTPFVYHPWSRNEPNDSSRREDCAEVRSSGEFNDVTCGDLRAHVCELDTCGDGVTADGEACDDGNLDAGDGCDPGCVLSGCGNGVVDPSEACDDGDRVAGDGCEADCTLPCADGAGADAAWKHGARCLFRVPTYTSWEDAEATCAAAGGHLPHAISADDMDALASTAPTSFLGLRAPAGTADFVWTDGTTSTFSAWPSGAPSATGASCSAWSAVDLAWSQVSCTEPRREVVCQLTTPGCGDGTIGADEACDFNARVGSGCAYGATQCDVCDARCEIVQGETSWCGDGYVDAGAGETCDDDVYPSPLCTACSADLGTTCVGAPSQCFADAYRVGPGLAIPIPDDGYDGTVPSMTCVDVEVAPATPATVGTVAVQIGLSHHWIGDLTMKVVSPAGTVVTLVSQPGWYEAHDNGAYGGTSASAGTQGAHLDMAAPITFADGLDPQSEAMGIGLTDGEIVCLDGSACGYTPSSGAAPDGLLRRLRGEPLAGIWRVCVGDSGAVDAGVIDQVAILSRP
jgi:cysteine-rich repeat protein